MQTPAHSAPPCRPLPQARCWERICVMGPGVDVGSADRITVWGWRGHPLLLTRASVLSAVSYTSYKKTPPPVPPRTTSKPLISVTAQSSTESTQDAYQDSRAQRTCPWPQDGHGLYNSTDSLDSNKAMSLALETAAAQRLMPDSQSGPARTGDKSILASKAEDFLRGPRSSVGVQVALQAHWSLPSRTTGP